MAHAHKDLSALPMVPTLNNTIVFHAHLVSLLLQALVHIRIIRHATHVQQGNIVQEVILDKLIARLVITVLLILGSQLSSLVLTVLTILILAGKTKVRVCHVLEVFCVLKALQIHLLVLKLKVVQQDSDHHFVQVVNIQIMECAQTVQPVCIAQQDLLTHLNVLQARIRQEPTLCQSMIVLYVRLALSALVMVNQSQLKAITLLLQATCIPLVQHLCNSSPVHQARILLELQLSKLQIA